jgi:hypothetical protein
MPGASLEGEGDDFSARQRYDSPGLAVQPNGAHPHGRGVVVRQRVREGALAVDEARFRVCLEARHALAEPPFLSAEERPQRLPDHVGRLEAQWLGAVENQHRARGSVRRFCQVVERVYPEFRYKSRFINAVYQRFRHAILSPPQATVRNRLVMEAGRPSPILGWICDGSTPCQR